MRFSIAAFLTVSGTGTGAALPTLLLQAVNYDGAKPRLEPTGFTCALQKQVSTIESFSSCVLCLRSGNIQIGGHTDVQCIAGLSVGSEPSGGVARILSKILPRKSVHNGVQMTEALYALAMDNSVHASNLRNAFLEALEALSVDLNLTVDDCRHQGRLVIDAGLQMMAADRIGKAATTGFLRSRHPELIRY